MASKPMDCVPWFACFCMMRVKKQTSPSALGGLKGIDKRVGSWGKKKVIEKGKEKGVGRAPAN
ncbi:MAG: hypothetical protein NTZ30_07830 [Planctomycetota bacterium]|nr:hypothetical protein [Planctomycetota bacterium]